MNFLLTILVWWEVLVSLSGLDWLELRSIKTLMFDEISAESKATMTKDGNFFWAISTNSFRFELWFI